MDKIPNVNKIDPIEIYPRPCIPCGGSVPPAPPFRYINYDTMVTNKPTLNGVMIEGNKTSADYHIEGADLSDYYTKEEVNTLIPDYLRNYYTKSQIDSKLPDMTKYYTKAQVDALLPDLSNYYTKAQTYSKSEVDSLLPDMSDYYSKTQVDALIPDMSDYYNVEEIDDIVNGLDGSISGKQDTLISGTNIKTVNSQSLLGSGNLDIISTLVVEYGRATHAELASAIVNSKPIVMTFGDADTLVMTAMSGWGGSDDVILQGNDGLFNVLVTVTPQEVWSIKSTQLATSEDVEIVAGIFKVKQIIQTMNITVPACTTDLVNTTIPKILFTLTDDEAAEYMFRGVISYEVFDAEFGGNRLNYMPVCQFTGSNGTELSIRGCVMGSNSKVARRVVCWALLQHR